MIPYTQTQGWMRVRFRVRVRVRAKVKARVSSFI
jgi:hypothetical protein